jgi:hypothetical protein
MNKENNNEVLPSFSFSIKEYLVIFEINSLITLNNFINTRLNSSISAITVIKIFTYGMYEYKNSVINSSEISMNIISKIISFITKRSSVNQDKVNKIYKMILAAKDLDDFEKIQEYVEKL